MPLLNREAIDGRTQVDWLRGERVCMALGSDSRSMTNSLANLRFRVRESTQQPAREYSHQSARWVRGDEETCIGLSEVFVTQEICGQMRLGKAGLKRV